MLFRRIREFGSEVRRDFYAQPATVKFLVALSAASGFAAMLALIASLWMFSSRVDQATERSIVNAGKIAAVQASRVLNLQDQCERDNAANADLVGFLDALPPQPGQPRLPPAERRRQILGFANAIVALHVDRRGRSTCAAYARHRATTTVP